MTISNIVLYIMSGTGNTYRVAQWIKEIAESRGISTQACMIDGVNEENRPGGAKDRLFSLMFPAHGLMVPWSRHADSVSKRKAGSNRHSLHDAVALKLYCSRKPGGCSSSP